jgi:hypothetical protein
VAVVSATADRPPEVSARFVADHPGGAAVVVEVDGAPRWTYVHGARRRPFVHPVVTPAGHVLSIDAPDDHPWHHGLWFTIKFVNGENFWEEYDAYGVLRHTATPKVEHGTAHGRLSIVGSLRWVRPDRETVIIDEDRRLTHVPLDERAYAIDLETTIVPRAAVVLDRTPFTTWGGYGGLTFRGRPDFHDTTITTADGQTGDRVLGGRGPWLGLSGLVGGDDGDAPAGIALLDAPANPNHPVPWYASTKADTYAASDADESWSNFVNAAFLWDGPLTLEAGQPLTWRYRVVVHDGAWGAERLALAHDAFLAE